MNKKEPNIAKNSGEMRENKKKSKIEPFFHLCWSGFAVLRKKMIVGGFLKHFDCDFKWLTESYDGF